MPRRNASRPASCCKSGAATERRNVAVNAEGTAKCMCPPPPRPGRTSSLVAIPQVALHQLAQVREHLLLALRLLLVVDHRQCRLLLRRVHLVLLADADSV